MSENDNVYIDTLLVDGNRLYVILTKNGTGEIYQIEKDKEVLEKIYEFAGSISARGNIWLDSSSGYYCPFTVSRKSFILNIHDGKITRFDISQNQFYECILNTTHVFYLEYKNRISTLYKHDFRNDQKVKIDSLSGGKRFIPFWNTKNPRYHLTDSSLYYTKGGDLYKVGASNRPIQLLDKDTVRDTSGLLMSISLEFMYNSELGYLSILFRGGTQNSYQILLNLAKNDSIVYSGPNMFYGHFPEEKLIGTDKGKVVITDFKTMAVDSIFTFRENLYCVNWGTYSDSLVLLHLFDNLNIESSYWALNVKGMTLDSLFGSRDYWYPLMDLHSSPKHLFVFLEEHLVRTNGRFMDTEFFDVNWKHDAGNSYKYGVEFSHYYFLIGGDKRSFWTIDFNANKGINLLAFHDENGNGVQDSTEFPIPKIGVYSEYDNLIYKGDENGKVTVLFNNGAHKLKMDYETEIWKTSVDTIAVSMPADSGKTIYVPFAAGRPFDSLSTDISSTINRCNRTAVAWFSVTNYGNRTAKVDCKLQLDTALRVSRYFLTPSSTTGNMVEYKQLEILPYHTKRIKILVSVPSWNAFIRQFEYSIGAASKAVKASSDLSATFRCSYDPNDKLVYPLNDTAANITQLGTPLTYTVRFQNTGNDTAFNIKIMDTLSNKLNWETFRLVGSSHFVQTQREKNGVLTFSFRNIMLPDSNIDEPASHGYVKYRVYPNKDLKPGSVVYNKAHIFFDFNPDIKTNTTTTTYDFVVDRTMIVSEPEKVALYPNPLEDQVSFNARNGIVKSVTIYTANGQLLEQHEPNQSQGVMETSHFEKGVYIFRFETNAGVTTVRAIK